MHAYTVGLCIMQTGRVVYPHPYSGLVSTVVLPATRRPLTPPQDLALTLPWSSSGEYSMYVQWFQVLEPLVHYTHVHGIPYAILYLKLSLLHKHHHNVLPLLAILCIHPTNCSKPTSLFNLFQSSRIENIYGTSVDLYIFVVVGVLFGNKYNLLAVVAVCT